MSALTIGANLDKDSHTVFRVWAPRPQSLCLRIHGRKSRDIPMVRDSEGYWSTELYDAGGPLDYTFVLDGKRSRPDPASRYQPKGVHGPSRIVDPEDFEWQDARWKGIDLGEYVFYEAHIGTLTREGTFVSAIKKLRYLKSLGVTCLEIMPVAQFPGKRNWGYDGVGLYAVQNSYGGPAGLKKLVNACHRMGIAVCLDVVYNHLGPEGNYLEEYGPYFTDRYHTPWGKALNFDDRGSDRVRDFVVQNAVYWIREYHVDALRLDAVHSIFDFSARHILEEIRDRVHETAKALGRKVHIIAESDLNDPRIIWPKRKGGYGLDAQWSDDFHHSLHTSLTGEQNGYYGDFDGIPSLSRALSEAFVYQGDYSAFRERRHGSSVRHMPTSRFVICVQNHDQVGNRAYGERLGKLAGFEAEKIAAATLLLSPYLPLIFMGQEYGEEMPFQYFVDHGDKALLRSVREGRKKEFVSFNWADVPDPANKKTFLGSKLRWQLSRRGKHKALFALYRELIRLRKRHAAILTAVGQPETSFDRDASWLGVEFGRKGRATMALFLSFTDSERIISNPFRRGVKRVVIHTEDKRYGGKGFSRATFGAGKSFWKIDFKGAVLVETAGARMR